MTVIRIVWYIAERGKYMMESNANSAEELRSMEREKRTSEVL